MRVHWWSVEVSATLPSVATARRSPHIRPTRVRPPGWLAASCTEASVPASSVFPVMWRNSDTLRTGQSLQDIDQALMDRVELVGAFREYVALDRLVQPVPLETAASSIEVGVSALYSRFRRVPAVVAQVEATVEAGHRRGASSRTAAARTLRVSSTGGTHFPSPIARLITSRHISSSTALVGASIRRSNSVQREGGIGPASSEQRSPLRV